MARKKKNQKSPKKSSREDAAKADDKHHDEDRNLPNPDKSPGAEERALDKGKKKWNPDNDGEFAPSARYTDEFTGIASDSDRPLTKKERRELEKEKKQRQAMLKEGRENARNNPIPDYIQKIIDDRAKDEGNELIATELWRKQNWNAVHSFFSSINDQIRQANQKHKADEEIGVVDHEKFLRLCETYSAKLQEAKNQQKGKRAWRFADLFREQVGEFLKMHHLPAGWNLPESVVEESVGLRDEYKDEESSDNDGDKRMRDEDDHSSTSELGPSDGMSDESGDSHSSDIDDASDDDTSDDNVDQGLDALEARAFKRIRGLSGGKVLYWWKKGHGTQTFVQYGPDETPIYRIRAGKFEPYDRREVEQVKSRHRGGKKDEETDDWLYGRNDVDAVLGVGWKIKDDDDKDVDALALIKPAPGAVYPQTKTLIRWKDGKITLEDRAFIRRVTSGSNLDGDRIIYQKALDLEKRHDKFEYSRKKSPQGRRQSVKSGRGVPKALSRRLDAVPEESGDEYSDPEDNVVLDDDRPRARSARLSSKVSSAKADSYRLATRDEPSPPSSKSTRSGSRSTGRRSTREEDPRDVLIRTLQDQLREQTNASKRQPPSSRQRQQDRWDNYDRDDYLSEVSSRPVRYSQRRGGYSRA